jgi:outer membrane protein OmpA-like peptidoglycan-associated protein
MASEYFVYGDFKGSFFTLQGIPLSNGEEFPEDLKHAIRIYKGEFSNATFEDEYKPEQYRKLNSFVLSNVPKVELKPGAQAPFPGSRVYNFSNLLLIDPKVTKTYQINGKTYGEIVSKAYGKTEPFPIVEQVNPHHEEKTPVVVDENYTGSTSSTEFIDDGGGRNRANHGGGDFNHIARGCFEKFWEILGLLILFLIILFFYKQCQSEKDQCELKRRASEELQMEKVLLDTTKVEYEKNLDAALLRISKVYFYRNSIDFEVSGKGNITRLFKLMQVYKDKVFVIEGYHSGSAFESGTNLDLIRANKMKDTLISLGLKSDRLIVVAKGDNPLLDSTNEISVSLVEGQVEREYNRNMRIEVKWKKDNEPKE